MAQIGVTLCSRMADYEASLTRAGGQVHLIDPAVDQAEGVLDSIDALVLTGGADVDPRTYGEAPHDTFCPAEAGRDAFELALTRAALERGMPLLAICRGIQILNVAAGGTLVQDIASQVPGALDHHVDTASSAIAHEVWVTAGSALATLMAERLEGDALLVNSRHHQAVGTVAPGFTATATAPDGVIEAIERADLAFCVGVQWHPENFWRTGEFRSLFEGLVAKAGR